MVVHRIRYEGQVYVGTTGKDGKTTFDPPLPEEYLREKEGNIEKAVANRQFPGLNTDTTFLADRGSLDSQFDTPEDLNRAVNGAKKAGYKPKSTDVYISGLARFPGDPQAFVNGGDAKGHIRKVCEERGIGCSGSVNVPQPELRQDPDVARKEAGKRALAKRMKKAQAMMKKKAPKE